MWLGVGRRLLRLVVVLYFVSLATFFLVELVPGDPATAILGTSGSAEQYERINQELGLDRPVLERYVEWLGATVRGDLGKTLVPPIDSVTDVLRSRLPVTIELALVSMTVALLIAIPIGVFSGYRQGTRADRAISATTFGLVALPAFLLGLVIIFTFVLHPVVGKALIGGLLVVAAATMLVNALRDRGSNRLSTTALRLAAVAGVVVLTVVLMAYFPRLPRQGFVRLTDDDGLAEHLRSIALPVATLAIPEVVIFVRLLRTDIIATLHEDYVLAARAKGLPSRTVLLRHALRPSSFSLITLAGISMGRLMGGTVIVETIYRLPGVGTMLVDSIQSRDYRLVQGGVLIVAAIYVAANAVVDAAYPMLDPRIRRLHTGRSP